MFSIILILTPTFYLQHSQTLRVPFIVPYNLEQRDHLQREHQKRYQWDCIRCDPRRVLPAGIRGVHLDPVPRRADFHPEAVLPDQDLLGYRQRSHVFWSFAGLLRRLLHQQR